MHHTSTPAAPRYCAPPRRSACPPQRGSAKRPRVGRPKWIAACRMVSTTVRWAGGAPREFGKS
eukprot:7560706-Alexandrium_andersonii.AAC.1